MLTVGVVLVVRVIFIREVLMGIFPAFCFQGLLASSKQARSSLPVLASYEKMAYSNRIIKSLG